MQTLIVRTYWMTLGDFGVWVGIHKLADYELLFRSKRTKEGHDYLTMSDNLNKVGIT